MRYVHKKEVGDPSKQKQIFTNINLKLLCCRFWSFTLWDCNNMIFPYWRIYWNKNEGGEIEYNEETYKMDENSLYIIPPFTSFNAQYLMNHTYNEGIHVTGKPVRFIDKETKTEQKHLLHFFIHFNLGVPFDNVNPGIYKIKLSNHYKDILNDIIINLGIENKKFPIKFNLKLQSFITEILSNMDNELWQTINIDQRVLKILRHIEFNMSENLSNESLASEVNMAPNSFAKLFKKEIKITLHNFVQKRKMARACELFDHSDKTIKEVAFILGYSNRYHFSRVFKSITSATPATYRLGTVIKI